MLSSGGPSDRQESELSDLSDSEVDKKVAVETVVKTTPTRRAAAAAAKLVKEESDEDEGIKDEGEITEKVVATKVRDSVEDYRDFPNVADLSARSPPRSRWSPPDKPCVFCSHNDHSLT